MWIVHRKEIRKLTFRALTLRRSEWIRSDEGLTQHHSFFRNLPPLFALMQVRLVETTVFNGTGVRLKWIRL